MRLRMARCPWLVAAGCAAMLPAPAQARNALQRDVEGYAIAACLAQQDQPDLRDQGEGWASVIVQRGHGELTPLMAVAAAVRTELAKGGMAVIHGETEPKDKPLPVLYCSEIIDAPAVQTAIREAIKNLAPSYQH